MNKFNHKEFNRIHKKDRLFLLWHRMINQCYKPKRCIFKISGRKTVTNEWFVFKNFYDWSMANGYSDNKFLHRKSLKKGFSPQNCIWNEARRFEKTIDERGV